MKQIYENSLHLRKTIRQMKHFILSIAALAVCVSLGAQTVRPECDVYFQSAIVNDEFDASNGVLVPSGTLAAFRLSPYVGINFGREHHLKGGFDVMKDFGAPDSKPVTELAVWYQYNHKGFTLAAGIFPGYLLTGFYSSFILSDAARFYDAHFDGFYLGWKRRKSHYELVFDWNGKYGDVRREQFNVMTSGAGWATPWLALCWEGMFHHYAGSQAVQGVVDDHIIHPYLQFELSPLLPLQRMEVSLGVLFGYQKDRLADIRHIPQGADLVVDIRQWNFGIRNRLYYGQNQLPFYHSKDAAGQEYGGDLYFRSPWWQLRTNGDSGLYNRLEAYWMKSLGDHVSLGLHAVFHFDDQGYVGCQQLFQAKVFLENIKLKKKIF